MKKSQWQFNWKICVFVGFFLPVCISLGVWQLHRAAQKKQHHAQFEQQWSQPAQALNTMPRVTAGDAFRKIKLIGQFDNEHVFLLDNTLYKGKPGFDVITPFVTERAGTYLVNRGWVAAPATREQLPVIMPGSAKTIEGYIYIPPGKAVVLKADAPTHAWPRVVSQLDVDAMAAPLQKNVFPYTIRLLSEEGDGLVRDWSIINMPPMRHIGYAVQWFAMALALVILFIWSARKESAQDENE